MRWMELHAAIGFSKILDHKSIFATLAEMTRINMRWIELQATIGCSKNFLHWPMFRYSDAEEIFQQTRRLTKYFTEPSTPKFSYNILRKSCNQWRFHVWGWVPLAKLRQSEAAKPKGMKIAQRRHHQFKLEWSLPILDGRILAAYYEIACDLINAWS